MNFTSSINDTLRAENHQYYEDSKCIECAPGLDVKNGRWVKVDEIKELEELMWPVYFDKEQDRALMLPMSHCMLTGSTGTGKSEVIVKNILSLLSNYKDEKKPSFMVTDLKGDISEQLGEKLMERGYNVSVLDMRNSFGSARYNFLTQIYDDYQEAMRIKKDLASNQITSIFDGVKYDSIKVARSKATIKYLTLLEGVERSVNELAIIMVPCDDPKNKSWADGARTMCEAIMRTMLRDSEDPRLGMTREKFTVANVARISFSTDETCSKIISWLERADDILCVRSALSGNYRLSARTTRDGYISTLNTQLAHYAAVSIAALTETADDIDLRKIAESDKPYAIFIITDDRQVTTNNICMMFMNNLINELTKAADSRTEHCLPRDFIILADEFANMPALPNISNKITTLRSRKIWMMMAIQSNQQLDMVYGTNQMEILRDNCDLQIFIGCNNDKTKEEFAHSMGQTIGSITSFAISNDGSISAQKQSNNVPVVRRSDLDALELGEFYIRSRKSQNMRSRMTPYFMQRDKNEKLAPITIVREFDPNANRYDIAAVLKTLRAKLKEWYDD
ncbi:MAG: type IV secretory system conjugative DNA transfer family protein [Clostridia bacterium]|nr:type IV secretory system conjugative DNA transfer family protein [Clostridia bacterium]